MQRPVHPSYGRGKQNVTVFICLDGTGREFFFFFFNSYVSRSPELRTAQSALHVMLLSYYIGMCVFHERQRDNCRRPRVLARFRECRAHVQRQATF